MYALSNGRLREKTGTSKVLRSLKDYSDMARGRSRGRMGERLGGLHGAIGQSPKVTLKPFSEEAPRLMSAAELMARLLFHLREDSL